MSLLGFGPERQLRQERLRDSPPLAVEAGKLGKVGGLEVVHVHLRLFAECGGVPGAGSDLRELGAEPALDLFPDDQVVASIALTASGNVAFAASLTDTVVPHLHVLGSGVFAASELLGVAANLGPSNEHTRQMPRQPGRFLRRRQG